MNKQPTRAGQAVLEYSAAAREPFRNGNIITIPARGYRCECGEALAAEWDYCPRCGGRAILEHPTVELLSLMDDFIQFLLVQKSEGKHWPDIWFGGTDESPFLVQMDIAVLEAYRRGHFYEYIVPTSMRTLTRKWGGSWKRQGDIFAYPLSFSWDELKWIGNFNKAEGLQVVATSLNAGKTERVLDTRHMLEGKWCQITLAGRSMVVVEGVIRAPDHSDLLLENPHALDQTAYLHNPAKAD